MKADNRAMKDQMENLSGKPELDEMRLIDEERSKKHERLHQNLVEDMKHAETRWREKSDSLTKQNFEMSEKLAAKELLLKGSQNKMNRQASELEQLRDLVVAQQQVFVCSALSDIDLLLVTYMLMDLHRCKMSGCYTLRSKADLPFPVRCV